MKRNINTIKLILVLLSLIFSVQSGQGQAVSAAKKIPMSPDVRVDTLPNGFTYYIKQNKKPEKKAELRLMINAGSILEDKEQLGLAHFTEHMAFNGTRSFPKTELVSYLQSIGVRFGADLNAYTGFDETVYILPIPTTDPAVVDKAFTILEEWAGQVSLKTEDIDSERAVVLEEYRSGLGAEERLRRKYFPRLLNNSRYAERLPIGTEENLKSFPPDQLRRFYKDWYRPNLMAVAVVGDIDVNEMEQKIKKHFSSLSTPSKIRPRPAITEIEPRKKAEAVVLTDPEIPVTRVMILNYVRRSEPMVTEQDYRRHIAEQLFNSMLSERLARQKEQPEPPYLGAFAGKQEFVRGYEAYTGVAISSNPNPEKALKTLLTEMERGKRYGFMAAELERAKLNMIERYRTSFNEKDKTESSSFVEEMVRNFLESEPMPGIEWEFNFVKQNLGGITLEEVNGLKKMIGTDPNELFILIMAPSQVAAKLPSESAVLAMAEEVAKSKIEALSDEATVSSLLEKEPATGSLVKEESFNDPKFTELTYNNGVKVIVMPTDFKNDEIVCRAVRFGGRLLYGDPDKYNSEYLGLTVTTQGFGKFTPSAMTRFSSGKKVSTSIALNEYTEEFSGNTRPQDLDFFLQRVHLELTQPRKDASLFQGMINQQKGVLSNLRNSPEVVYEDTLEGLLTQNHPRARRLPTSADLDKIELDRSLEIYRERIGNAHGWNFIFVGNIDAEKAKPLLAKYLGGLPSSPREVKYRDLGIRYPKGIENKEVYKGAEQKSIVTIAFTGEANYSDDEKLRFDALLNVLRTRAIEKIREEMGSSYSPGVTGGFDRTPIGRYRLQFSVECGPENVQRVVEAITRMTDEITAKGVTDSELNKAKESFKNRYREVVKTNEYWLQRLSERSLYGTDLKTVNEYEKRVNALMTAEIMKAANDYLNSKNYIKLVLYPEKQSAPQK
jgi:zinc protease